MIVLALLIPSLIILAAFLIVIRMYKKLVSSGNDLVPAPTTLLLYNCSLIVGILTVPFLAIYAAIELYKLTFITITLHYGSAMILDWFK